MSDAIQFPENRAEAAKQLADRYMALWNGPDAADGRVQRNYTFVDGA